MQLPIISPSHKRATLATTHKLLPETSYAVAESEADDYRKAGHKNILILPDSTTGNLSRVRNWILKHFEHMVIMMDDDIKRIIRWNGTERKELTTEESIRQIEQHTELALEMGVTAWGMNVINDKRSYRETSPFSFTNILLQPFICHLGHGCLFDERLPLKEDYDISLQILNKHRRILRVNYLSYLCDHQTMAGGCANIRTSLKESEQMDILIKKWGGRIVRRDNQRRNFAGKEKLRGQDLNPIIHIPIKGI